MLILNGTPEIKAAAQLKKLQVIAQQKTLKLQQNVLFRLGESLSRLELFRLKKKMNIRFGKISRIWSRSRNQFLRFRVQWKPSQLKVKIRDIAPVYQRGANHARDQTHKIQWSAPLRAVLPKWIRGMTPLEKKWHGSCESHPQKGGIQWYSAIGKGKLSQKSLSSVFF